MPASKPIKFIINSGGCKICTSHHLDKDGYPEYSKNYKRWKMARFIYTLKYGEIKKGLCVCHKCDNPSCINIEHLFLATSSENTRDKVMKNRQARGKLVSYPKKLSEKTVLKIRRENGNQYSIAKKYKVSQSLISNIKTRKAWNHVK